MRKIVDDPRLIYKCCKLYYENDATQQEIADRLGVSRVTVSRLLQAGRDRGIVKIRIISPDNLSYSDMEQKLEELYDLKEVVIVENSPLATRHDHLNDISAETLALLEIYLRDGDYVGVSMGMTLHNIVSGRRRTSDPIHCTFVPMLGGVGTTRGSAVNIDSNNSAVNIDSNNIARKFANQFGAQYLEFFAPAVFSDAEVLEGFMKETAMRNVRAVYEQISTVITGIGTPHSASSTMLEAGFITREEMDELIDRGVAGDLSLRFYDFDGDNTPFRSFNSRVTGMTLGCLRRVPNKIGIGWGEEKARAVHGALQGDFVNILVTDQQCARELIRFAEKENTNA